MMHAAPPADLQLGERYRLIIDTLHRVCIDLIASTHVSALTTESSHYSSNHCLISMQQIAMKPLFYARLYPGLSLSPGGLSFRYPCRI